MTELGPDALFPPEMAARGVLPSSSPQRADGPGGCDERLWRTGPRRTTVEENRMQRGSDP